MPARSSPPGGAGAPAPAGVGLLNPAIDPVRLLKQYWKWMAASVVVGCVLGVAAHVAFKRLMPLYTAQTILKVNPVLDDVTQSGQSTGSKQAGPEEMSRFMYTQIQVILSKQTFQDAADDGTVRNDTDWAKQFQKSNGQYDSSKAARRLEKRVVSARVIPDTQLIMISSTTGSPKDAAAIAQTVTKVYLARYTQGASQQNTNQMEVMSTQQKNLQNDRTALERRMQRLLLDSSIESVQFNETDASQKIDTLNKLLAETKNDVEEAKARLEQYESLLTQPGGVTYPDFLRGDVAKEPTMYVHDQNIASARAQLQSARIRFGPNHPEVRRLDAMVHAEEEVRRIDEQRLMGEKFNSLIELTRETVRSAEAKVREMDEERKAAMQRSGELTRLIEEYTILKKDAERKGEMIEKLNSEIGDLRALMDRDASKRVVVSQPATFPELPSFPKIEVMIPAFAILSLGLVAGGLLLREMLEQRVRTPADVALLPRMKVLGMISDLSEDPSKPSSPDTAVREQPHGAVAEQIRQIRANILKVVQPGEIKTLVVTSGLPGSGTTMLVANAGRLVAMLDRRVLMIDANLRRARLHEVFAAPDAPGLSEILAGESTLSAAARALDLPNLCLLTAGGKGSRVYERLNSEAMSRLLEEAKARFDVILIDTPPMTVAGDAATLAARCDASILMVRAYSETRGLVARLRGQLADSRAEFLGVIVNGVKSAAGGYFRKNIQLSHEYHGAQAPTAA